LGPVLRMIKSTANTQSSALENVPFLGHNSGFDLGINRAWPLFLPPQTRDMIWNYSLFLVIFSSRGGLRFVQSICVIDRICGQTPRRLVCKVGAN
jgi:hypothetical protein